MATKDLPLTFDEALAIWYALQVAIASDKLTPDEEQILLRLSDRLCNL